jgi:hypothetical protein
MLSLVWRWNLLIMYSLFLTFSLFIYFLCLPSCSLLSLVPSTSLFMFHSLIHCWCLSSLSYSLMQPSTSQSEHVSMLWHSCAVRTLSCRLHSVSYVLKITRNSSPGNQFCSNSLILFHNSGFSSKFHLVRMLCSISGIHYQFCFEISSY